MVCLKPQILPSSPGIWRRDPISKASTKPFSISQQEERARPPVGERAQRKEGGRHREHRTQVFGPGDSRNQDCEK